MQPVSEHVASPVPPTAAAPFSFPVMATIAPVIVSVALWLITSSTFALVFAALGPAVAIASLADARLQSRRRSRRERQRFDGEVAATRSDLAAAHDRERDLLAAIAPSAARLVDGRWSEAEQWLGSLGDIVAVSLGRGERPSGVVLDGMPSPSRANGDYNGALRDLAETARVVRDAPVVVDARLGLGIVGPPEVCTAVARSVLVQVLATLPPDTHVVTVCAPVHDWSWLDGLPHALNHGDGDRDNDSGCAVVRVAHPSAQLVVAVAPSREQLPRATRIVVRAEGVRGSIEQHPDPSFLAPVVVELTSREQAAAVVRRFAAHAAREGIVGPGGLPDAVTFGECVPSPGERHGGLSSTVALAAAGPVTIDLVEHGPHAVVGGTTGSGKSELLTAWILAMARAHSPRDATVLLVDFKGGSAFASLASLPHCVGVITDLDEASAGRALDSLAAELRRRERLLAAAGAKSIDAADDPGHPGSIARPPRLVIVVDEFAAMVSGFPELHGLFGDIAARGRSLGVHLILCTQRPAGVIRDAVLANSAIRISLRVNNRADSTAVIGTDAAAALPLSPRGRALVSTDGDEPVLAQFPLVVAADVEAVSLLWAHDDFRPHRPWLDPLPPTIERWQLDAHSDDGPGRGEPAEPENGIPFGVLDDPANQTQPVAFYRPREHGNLLVLGGAGSGKTSCLGSLADGASDAPHARDAVEQLPQHIEEAWDALVALLADIRSPDGVASDRPPGRIVLLDDLDVVVSRYTDDYESAVLELLTQCLREGPARGIHFVLAAQRLTAGLHPIAALCGSRLLLRLPSRQEHVLAGGDGQDFGERMPPGAGRWLGLRVQVAKPDPVAQHQPSSHQPTQHQPTQHQPTPHRPTIDLARPLAVVSNRPHSFADRLRRAFPEFTPGSITLLGDTADSSSPDISVSSGGRPTAIVGDVEAWQAQWGALAVLRSTHTVIVDACTASEFRTVTRSRVLPPPLAARGDTFWVMTADGGVSRARLPGH